MIKSLTSVGDRGPTLMIDILKAGKICYILGILLLIKNDGAPEIIKNCSILVHKTMMSQIV